MAKMLICAGLLATVASAQQVAWPTQTAWEAIGHAETFDKINDPAPTQGPAAGHLVKRYWPPSGSVCGYVTSDAHYPVACNEGEFCETDSNRAWLCCSTTSESFNGKVTSTFNVGCTQLGPPTCYDWNHTTDCTGKCASTAAVCTDLNYPACALLTSEILSTVTLAFCDTTSYVLPVAWTFNTYLTVGNTSTPEGVTFTFPQPSGTSQATAEATASSASSQTNAASLAMHFTISRLLVYVAGVISLGIISS